MGGVRDQIMGSLRREPLPSVHRQASIQRTVAPSGSQWSAWNNAAPAPSTQSRGIPNKELEAAEPWLKRPLRSSLRSSWCKIALTVPMLLIVVVILAVVLSIETKHHKNISRAAAITPTRNGNIVTLADGQYQGTTQHNGITSWLGMRYAAAPVGNLRFAAPQDPPKFAGVIQANAFGPGCPGLGPSTSGTEDCLFVDVFAPTKATTDSKLPVYIFIQGGGFQGTGSHMNGTGLIRAADMNLVTVMMTYRGGPFGFLASAEVQKGASLNNGLKDQRKVFEWVQDNIVAFGGDPKHVTIGGASAGGGSVAIHLTSYGGKDFGLFQAAAAESQSFAAIRTVDESQYQYNALVGRLGCTGQNDTLACLRSKDYATFQAGNVPDPFPGAPGKPIFPYNPTLDYDFIPGYVLDMYQKGQYIKIPTIWGDDTNEGSVFTPRNITNRRMANNFLRDQFPALTASQLDTYNQLYGFNASPSETYWHRPSRAYGETRYVCPGIQLSDNMAKTGQPNVWNYRFNVMDPGQIAMGLGVPHTTEVGAIWGPHWVASPPSYQTTNKNIVPVIQGYWTSFMRTFDPNTLRHKGTPEWTRWQVGQNNRIMFNANNTHMEQVVDPQLSRCNFLSGISVLIKQ